MPVESFKNMSMAAGSIVEVYNISKDSKSTVYKYNVLDELVLGGKLFSSVHCLYQISLQNIRLTK
jgi:hypothetical protein